MHQVLILGAGKSSGYLIEYLLKWNRCRLVLADLSEDCLSPYSNQIETVLLSPADSDARSRLISQSFLVISMLPAFMHPEVAADCLRYGVHLATASYISPELKAMEQDIQHAGLWFMNECGLDPGLDHMSAMQIFRKIQSNGGIIRGFHSYCGGLVSPESMDNPWGYKFSWNPRNVILAGQGTARYLEGGELKFKPYHRVFSDAQQVEFQDGSRWDAYPNRDSISYLEVYGLNGVQDMIRGTLRYEGFCEAWDILVQMGLTDDSYKFPLDNQSTYQTFASAFLPGKGRDFRHRMNQLKPGGFRKDAVEKVIWTGLFDDMYISMAEGSPAMIVQQLLEKKWKLNAKDKDLVLMQHKVNYEQDGQRKVLVSSLQVEGKDARHTAMAKTVGLPLAATCRHFLEGNLRSRGLLIPIDEEVYQRVLPEMESSGIRFHEQES
jgi:saccharopine dehydrogenase-like NADP-dependent oxidoreductase